MILLPTSYLPPISYFALLAQNDEVVIEQYETFPKSTYRNRATILSANGPLDLSVPIVRTNGNHTMTKDIGISYAEKWPIKHWRAIESAYNSSPYFLYYQDGLKKIILNPQESILQLNGQLLDFLLKKLHIKAQTSYSMDYMPPTGESGDYRAVFCPKKANDGLHMPEYPQVFETRYPFQPNLSILDLLFNIGPDSKGYLLKIEVPHPASQVPNPAFPSPQHLNTIE